uniref:Uncharacterized protein n=1 Tax=Romanomermis culicivorax TaxID=13658 RepID=A0A915L1M3_ROMCU
MAKVLSLRGCSLSLLQRKCLKKGGGAILVDSSKHCWMFLSLAMLTDEIPGFSTEAKSMNAVTSHKKIIIDFVILTNSGKVDGKLSELLESNFIRN